MPPAMTALLVRALVERWHEPTSRLRSVVDRAVAWRNRESGSRLCALRCARWWLHLRSRRRWGPRCSNRGAQKLRSWVWRRRIGLRRGRRWARWRMRSERSNWRWSGMVLCCPTAIGPLGADVQDAVQTW